MLLVLLLTFIVLLFLIIHGGLYHGEIQQRFQRFEVLIVVSGRYCDIIPETRNSEVRVNVYC
jgi:hypothetical protein